MIIRSQHKTAYFLLVKLLIYKQIGLYMPLKLERI